MSQYEFTVSVSIAETDGGAWRAKGENITLFLEAGNRPELIGYVVSAVQAFGHWLVESKPEDEDLVEYCRSVGVDCREVEEGGLELAVKELHEAMDLAVKELHEAMDQASELLALTQRLPA